MRKLFLGWAVSVLLIGQASAWGLLHRSCRVCTGNNVVPPDGYGFLGSPPEWYGWGAPSPGAVLDAPPREFWGAPAAEDRMPAAYADAVWGAVSPAAPTMPVAPLPPASLLPQGPAFPWLCAWPLP